MFNYFVQQKKTSIVQEVKEEEDKVWASDFKWWDISVGRFKEGKKMWTLIWVLNNVIGLKSQKLL